MERETFRFDARTGSTAIAFLVALLFLWSLPVLSAEEPAEGKPQIKLIAPLDKAWVTTEQVFLAGAVIGAEAKSVTVKGVSVPGDSLPVEGGGFGGLVTLDKGENTIQVSAGGLSATVKVYRGDGLGYQGWQLTVTREADGPWVVTDEVELKGDPTQ